MTLSPRQREILRLIAQGKSDKEISLVLNIAQRTVTGHVERILMRLQANHRAHAVYIFFCK